MNIIEQINQAHEVYKNQQQLIGIAIDEPGRGELIAGVPVVCKISEVKEYVAKANAKLLFSLFRPDRMAERYELLKNLGISPTMFTRFVHPLAYVSASANIGHGAVILSNSTIQSKVSVGNYSIISSNVTIEHEVIMGEANFIAANACIGAKVHMGAANFMGLNTSVREEVVIGNTNFIGMHSLVLEDLNNTEMVYGIPAKKRK